MNRLFSYLIIIFFMVGFSHSAYSSPIYFKAYLDGPSEAPPNASPGIGSAWGVLDDFAHTLSVNATFSGLLGNVTAAHIHAATPDAGTGTAGVATTTPTFPGFPSGVTSGIYSNTFDTTLASTYRAAFITANGGTPLSAEAALSEAIREGKAYFNIHTDQFPGGEIRGFLQVPEPAMTSLMTLGVLGFAFAKRRAV